MLQSYCVCNRLFVSYLFFVLCYVKGNRFTQFMETPRKEKFGGNVA